MKDEKFCFKKSTGFIALVGILLVGFVLFAQMSNTSTTSTNTRAASCVENVTKCADGTFAGQCSKMSNGDFNGYKCGCFGKAYAELKKKADGTDATGCEKPVANTVYCQFNNEIVTDTSSKYKWVDSTATVANAGTGLAVGDPIKCIVDVVKNENVGARCFTNASGDINKRYSLWNAETKANCPVPAGSCTGKCTGANGSTWDQGKCDPAGTGKVCACQAGKTYPTWNLDRGVCPLPIVEPTTAL